MCVFREEHGYQVYVPIDTYSVQGIPLLLTQYFHRTTLLMYITNLFKSTSYNNITSISLLCKVVTVQLTGYLCKHMYLCEH